MSAYFFYSILQYKHSLLTREAINVGILFGFVQEKKLVFVPGTSDRVRLLYYDFDPTLFDLTLQHVLNQVALENEFPDRIVQHFDKNFGNYISNKFLNTDSTVLQFTEPSKALTISEMQMTIDKYTAFLLPAQPLSTQMPNGSDYRKRA